MPQVILVDPLKCRMWHLHDRLEAHITEQSCRMEIASFLAHGQFVPALGRALRGDADYEVELITGARRLFVAKLLNKPLAVELRYLSDREALIAMDAENRIRRDISPYERALSYGSWIRSGHFKSQEDISRALKISPSQVSRVLRMAQLPAVIVQAFPDPTELREAWTLNLLKHLEDPVSRLAILGAARTICKSPNRSSAKDVYRQLLTATANGPRLVLPHHDIVMRGKTGVPLFRIRQQRESVAILLPIESVAEPTLREISDAVVRILQAATSQPADSSVIS